MSPILLRFQFAGTPLALHAYGTAMVLAVATVIVVGWITARARGLPGKAALAYVLVVGLSLPVGSRLLYWAVDPEASASTPSALTELEFRGFLLPGGALLALAGSVVVCRITRLDAWRMADSVTPALGLAGAVLRLGCFLNGCCFGRETSLPWGVRFPWGSPAHRYQVDLDFDRVFAPPLPVHPTQLYELGAFLTAAAIAATMLRRGWSNGVPALTATAWYLAFRLLNLMFRVPLAATCWSTASQALLFSLLLAACVGVLARRGAQGLTVPKSTMAQE